MTARRMVYASLLAGIAAGLNAGPPPPPQLSLVVKKVEIAGYNRELRSASAHATMAISSNASVTLNSLSVEFSNVSANGELVKIAQIIETMKIEPGKDNIHPFDLTLPQASLGKDPAALAALAGQKIHIEGDALFRVTRREPEKAGKDVDPVHVHFDSNADVSVADGVSNLLSSALDSMKAAASSVLGGLKPGVPDWQKDVRANQGDLVLVARADCGDGKAPVFRTGYQISENRVLLPVSLAAGCRVRVWNWTNDPAKSKSMSDSNAVEVTRLRSLATTEGPAALGQIAVYRVAGDGRLAISRTPQTAPWPKENKDAVDIAVFSAAARTDPPQFSAELKSLKAGAANGILRLAQPLDDSAAVAPVFTSDGLVGFLASQDTVVSFADVWDRALTVKEPAPAPATTEAKPPVFAPIPAPIPAPPPPPPTQTHILRVVTHPPGADVSIRRKSDESEIARGNQQDFNVPGGDYVVHVSKDGYAPRDREIPVDDDVQWEVTLKPAAAAPPVKTAGRTSQISLTVDPAGARVLVDGKPVSGTHLTLPFGTHEFRISKEGYAEKVVTVSVNEPKKDLDVRLQPVQAGKLTITGIDGAEVFVDGKPRNQRTPCIVIFDRPGRYTIELKRDGRIEGSKVYDIGSADIGWTIAN